MGRQESFEEREAFFALVGPLEEEHIALDGAAKEMAFRVEPRPVPQGLLHDGLPPGHIAFRGDFDKPPEKPALKLSTSHH